MPYKIFLDDLRYPEKLEDWHIARSSEEGIRIIEELGLPNFISFDHDLGGDDDAIKFIKKMIAFMFNYNMKLPKGFDYQVHSMNPVGRENIHGLMRNFVKTFSQP